MIRHSHAAGHARRLLHSLFKDDARAIEQQVERIRQQAPQIRRMPEAERERWELLAAIAEALVPNTPARRISPVRIAACRRLLEHLSGSGGPEPVELRPARPYSTTNARREPALATRP
jgi:hypothetical protein